MSQNGLSAAGLRCVLGGRVVVDGVDLSVPNGRVVGLLGPNGAGKTTTFQVIAGLTPAQGHVELNGCSLDGLPLWRRVRAGLGYVPQRPSLFRALTVAQHIEMLGLTALEVGQVLSMVGLLDLAKRRAEVLSGGERKRLEIARGVALRPTVMLLDEPFAGVDPKGVAALQVLVRRLADEHGCGVLITDHAVAATLPICDHALILDAGVSIAEGPPAEVAADPLVGQRYLGPGFTLAPQPG